MRNFLCFLATFFPHVRCTHVHRTNIVRWTHVHRTNFLNLIFFLSSHVFYRRRTMHVRAPHVERTCSCLLCHWLVQQFIEHQELTFTVPSRYVLGTYNVRFAHRFCISLCRIYTDIKLLSPKCKRFKQIWIQTIQLLAVAPNMAIINLEAAT